MKINPIMNQSLYSNYQTVKPTVQRKPKTEEKVDEVSFSDKAKSFSKVMSDARDKVNGEHGIQEDRMKINEITEAIRKGTYRVDSGKIAEKMLGSVFLG